MDLTKCNTCDKNVLTKPDGTCPACGNIASGPSKASERLLHREIQRDKERCSQGKGVIIAGLALRLWQYPKRRRQKTPADVGGAPLKPDHGPECRCEDSQKLDWLFDIL